MVEGRPPGSTDKQDAHRGPSEQLSPICGDGLRAGGGFGLTIGDDDLQPVGELRTENDLRQLVVTVEASPAFLRGR